MDSLGELVFRDGRMETFWFGIFVLVLMFSFVFVLQMGLRFGRWERRQSKVGDVCEKV